jgi:hypothetical protein
MKHTTISLFAVLFGLTASSQVEEFQFQTFDIYSEFTECSWKAYSHWMMDNWEEYYEYGLDPDLGIFEDFGYDSLIVGGVFRGDNRNPSAIEGVICYYTIVATSLTSGKKDSVTIILGEPLEQVVYFLDL